MEGRLALFLTASLILGATGHLMIKEGVSRAGHGLIDFINPVFVFGVFCFFLSMVFWLPFLSSRPVAQAVPMAGLTYVLVALGAGLIKGEWLSTFQWGGILLVGAGVWMLSLK